MNTQITNINMIKSIVEQVFKAIDEFGLSCIFKTLCKRIEIDMLG